MNRMFRLALILAGFCACAQFAHALPAQVVFQRSLSVDRSTNIFTTNAFDVKFVLGDSFFTPTNPVSLFAGTSITPADVGKVLTATAIDPNFAAVSERITDSQNEFIQFLLTEHSSGRAEKRGWNERGFFIGVATPNEPDLAGAKITSLALSIDGFTLDPPGTASASAVGGGPPVALAMTFTVYGSPVPEPAAALLLVIGLPALRGAGYTARRTARSH